MTKTSTNTQVETTTVTVPVPIQVTYERLQYVGLRDEDYHVIVDGVYLGVVGNYPGEKFWAATQSGDGTGKLGQYATRDEAAAALVLADLEVPTHR